MSIRYTRPQYQSSSSRDEKRTCRFEVPIERWKLYAYFFFWTMVILCHVLTRTLVVERLAAGVDKSSTDQQRWGCGPFNRGPESEFGLEYGDGFDYSTESHLQEAFRFSNVCTNWDYSPARELGAMYFPFFEYSLVVYLLLRIVETMLSYRRGEIPKWFWTLSKIYLALSIYLCINFRMIFVCLAYENLSGHTAGFLGLQVALLLVAIHDITHIYLTGQSHPYINLSSEQTRRYAMIYFVANIIVSYFKVTATISIVMKGHGPAYYKKPFAFGLVQGQLVDHLWMIANALMPVFISYVRSKDEEPLTIEITMPEHYYDTDDAETEETEGLMN